MYIYLCEDKKVENAKSYCLLKDVRNNEEYVVDGNQLKEKMRSRELDVLNLTLTSDNRLVEASKDKIAKLSGFLNAPDSIKQDLKPLDLNCLDEVDKFVDELLSSSIQEYLGDMSKYVEIGNFNHDKNTCVLNFKLGTDTNVILRYDDIVYGIEDSYDNESILYFDIGIQVIGVANKRASSKIGDGRIFKVSDCLYSSDSLYFYFVFENGKMKIDADTYSINDIR